MVMYESSGSTLTLNYGKYVPGAAEVIRDIKDAPIEQSNKKSFTNEKILAIFASLGKKAETEIVKNAEQLGFKRINGLKVLSFDIPAAHMSEQALLMRN